MLYLCFLCVTMLCWSSHSILFQFSGLNFKFPANINFNNKISSVIYFSLWNEMHFPKGFFILNAVFIGIGFTILAGYLQEAFFLFHESPQLNIYPLAFFSMKKNVVNDVIHTNEWQMVVCVFFGRLTFLWEFFSIFKQCTEVNYAIFGKQTLVWIVIVGARIKWYPLITSS